MYFFLIKCSDDDNDKEINHPPVEERVLLIVLRKIGKLTMKNAVFWDVAPCRSYVSRRFGGTYLLHLQVREIRERGTSVSRWLRIFLP
jgi:hypothetical protein